MLSSTLNTWSTSVGPRAAFFLQFLTCPGMLGAFAPSSGHLAREMLRSIDLGPGARIAEYGPGTGAFTQAILARLHPDATFFAIERNQALAERLRQRFPRLHLHNASAEDVERIARLERAERLDAIVCGLPWASFGEDLQTRILDASVRVLRPGGRFVLCGYPLGLMLPAGKRFYRLLPRYFSSIERGPLVWRNLPPAFAVHCVRGPNPPRAGAGSPPAHLR